MLCLFCVLPTRSTSQTCDRKCVRSKYDATRIARRPTKDKSTRGEESIALMRRRIGQDDAASQGNAEGTPDASSSLRARRHRRCCRASPRSVAGIGCVALALVTTTRSSLRNRLKTNASSAARSGNSVHRSRPARFTANTPPQAISPVTQGNVHKAFPAIQLRNGADASAQRNGCTIRGRTSDNTLATSSNVFGESSICRARHSLQSRSRRCQQTAGLQVF